MESKAPSNYVPAPGRADTEERCFQLISCGPGGGQSGGGCYKWAECATCPGADWSYRSAVESDEPVADK
jgi:hypothetical protein